METSRIFSLSPSEQQREIETTVTNATSGVPLRRSEQSSNKDENCAQSSKDDNDAPLRGRRRRIDISLNHGGPTVIPGRESHTSDMKVFDEYIRRLRHSDRSVVDQPFDEPFWSFVRATLAKVSKRIGFEEQMDRNCVEPIHPQMSDALLQKMSDISLLNPINPTALSSGSNICLDTVLSELFHATHIGLVHMRWAPDCMRCGSPVCAHERLSSLPSHAQCNSCRLDNVITSLDNIKVLFTLNVEVLHVLAANIACQPSVASRNENVIFAPVPPTSNNRGFRYSVGCGGNDYMIRKAPLKAGRYRVRCPIAMTDCYLVVDREAQVEDEPITLPLKVSDMRTGSSVELPTLSIPHGKVHFDIFADTKSFFVLWVQNDKDGDVLFLLPEEERQPFTSASDVMHHPIFQRYFSQQQIVAMHSSLEIQRVVLVFTDVVGSTALYASLGDGRALRLVRKHYEVLFEAFSQSGRVVKTIGDAVMASFTCGRSAVEAVERALKNVSRYCVRPSGSDGAGAPLEIRVGVHAGSAIVVPLNGINDYFGQTVNVAARVGAAARPSEVLASEAFLSGDPGAADAYEELLARGQGFIESYQGGLTLKGIANPVRARGCRYVAGNPKCIDISSAQLTVEKGTAAGMGLPCMFKRPRGSVDEDGTDKKIKLPRRVSNFAA